MSPPWPDRLFVSLAPDWLALAQVGGRLRPRLDARDVVDGERPLETLQAAMDALANQHLQVSVVLSNRLVRYAVVPFEPALAGAEEEIALARYHFTRIHGERAKAWELRLSEGPPGAARVACAVDHELLAGIRACFPPTRRPRLVSIQPYLMAAFNRARGKMAKEGAWLALLEPRCACLAFVTRSGWHSVQSLRADAAGPAELGEILERECMRAQVPAPRKALIHGRTIAQAAGWLLSQLALPELVGYRPLADRRLAMALCAR